ncbi:unnamed protein product [Durusdinium trenchii]|uniref:Kinesin light chain n=1 Tax=Durusdinium trenchii TaxID=1381693 RepID=A0ABP0J8F7_9DINO
MTGLAKVLHEQGRYGEAETLLRKVVKTRTTKMGEDIPTYEVLRQLAATLVAQGKHLEAEKLYRQAVQGLTAMLGNQHLRTLSCLRGLAAVLHRNSKLEEAELAYKRSYVGLKAKLGTKHYKTLAAMEGLAAVLRDAGKPEEADHLFEKLTVVLTSAYGENSLQTLSAVGHHASNLKDQGKLEEAEQLYRQVLQGLVQQFGNDDMLSLSCMNKLGGVLHQQQKLTESENIFRLTVSRLTKHFGSEHPETRKATLGWAMVLKEQNPSEALTLFQRLQPNRARKPNLRRPNSFHGRGEPKLDMSANFGRHVTSRQLLLLPLYVLSARKLLYSLVGSKDGKAQTEALQRILRMPVHNIMLALYPRVYPLPGNTPEGVDLPRHCPAAEEQVSRGPAPAYLVTNGFGMWYHQSGDRPELREAAGELAERIREVLQPVSDWIPLFDLPRLSVPLKTEEKIMQEATPSGRPRYGSRTPHIAAVAKSSSEHISWPEKVLLSSLFVEGTGVTEMSYSDWVLFLQEQLALRLSES